MSGQRGRGIAAAMSLLIVVLVLVYPFFIYYQINNISPSWFAVVLFCVLILRFAVVSKEKDASDWIMLAVISAFCCSVVIFESETLLKFYPVLMSVGMGLIFIASLKSEQSLIEKFLKAANKTPPPQALGYLRTLSLLWGILLLLNGVVSAYIAIYSSISVWAFYNGFLSYMIMASFAFAEWIYRGYYKKKHKILDE